jgi:hypothetical protein
MGIAQPILIRKEGKISKCHSDYLPGYYAMLRDCGYALCCAFCKTGIRPEFGKS